MCSSDLDASVAGLLLSAGAWVFGGQEVAGAVAAGALGSLVNLWAMQRAISGAGQVPNALIMARLVGKMAFGGIVLYALCRTLPVAPVLGGFCAVMLALGVRGFAGLAAPPQTPEPG